MQVIARIKEVRTSPRKMRLVADSIRNLSLPEAQDALSVIDKKGAYDLRKALKSAVANAVNNANLDKSNLKIARIDISEGMPLKRYHPSTRGRIHPYQKRSSSVRIVLEEKVVSVPVIPAKSEDKKGETNS
ncbi:MAG: 50S ribosomal protein L22 [Patescibacteria group bacterium]